MPPISASQNRQRTFHDLTDRSGLGAEGALGGGEADLGMKVLRCENGRDAARPVPLTPAVPKKARVNPHRRGLDLCDLCLGFRAEVESRGSHFHEEAAVFVARIFAHEGDERLQLFGKASLARE